MTYRATLSSAFGLYLTGAVLVALCIATGVIVRPAYGGLVAAGCGIVAWLLAVRIRCHVRVSPEELESRTLVGGGSLRWSEIVRVRRMAAAGYWPSRLYGPSVMEFASSGRRLRMNFKLYPAECFRDVVRCMPQGLEVEG